MTSALRSTTGATANTVSIGTGDMLGADFALANTVGILWVDGVVDGVVDAATLGTTYSGVTPTTLPNGARVFKLLANY